MPKLGCGFSDRRFTPGVSAGSSMAVLMRIPAAGMAVNHLVEVDGAGSSLGPVAAV
jgi:hypothetical protein